LRAKKPRYLPGASSERPAVVSLSERPSKALVARGQVAENRAVLSREQDHVGLALSIAGDGGDHLTEGWKKPKTWV
jgi:hypothetical protein